MTTAKEDLEPLYDFVCQYLMEHKIPPSVREIAEGLYMSPSTVSRYLDKLVIAGRIVREPGVARGIWLCDPPNNSSD